MEQFEFNFSKPKEPTEEELRVQYQKLVGINPIFRNLSLEEMVIALENPDKERERLAAIDNESDKEDIQNTYRR